MPGDALAVDIGGTKLAVALVDADGRVSASRRAPTPRSTDPEVVWGALAELIGDPGGRGIGVGCGGPMRWPAGEISALNIAAWREFPLRARLQALTSAPVRVHNDAVAVAVGEHWRGAGAGAANLLGMVVSTGVGGGLILGGRVVDGGTGNAGHIGHVCVDPRGPRCACGARGCLEAIASGPRTVAWAAEQGWRNPAGADGAVLVADARAGHPVALAALRRAGQALGVAIASAAHLCDLDLVCIGGGLARAGDLLFTPLRDALAAHARLDFAGRVEVVPAALGQDAGLVGAAAFVLAGDAYWSPDES